QAALAGAVEAAAQTFRLGLSGVGGDVKPRRIGGTDGGIDAGAGEGGVLELGELLIGGRVAGALVGIDEAGARPMGAGQGPRRRLRLQPAGNGSQGGGEEGSHGFSLLG